MGRRQTLFWPLQPVVSGPLGFLTLLLPPMDSGLSLHASLLPWEAFVLPPPVWLGVRLRKSPYNKLKGSRWISSEFLNLDSKEIISGLLISVRIFKICAFSSTFV